MPATLRPAASSPVASPSYLGLLPPLEGGAWLKVMASCLPALGLSTDLQCHLPHQLGEARRGVSARQLLRSPDGQGCKHFRILASLEALPDTGFLKGILEVASSLV